MPSFWPVLTNIELKSSSTRRAGTSSSRRPECQAPAMPQPIEVYCHHCESTLKLKNRAAEGRIVPCPRCRKKFRIEIPAQATYDEYEYDAYEEEVDAYEEYEAPRRSNRASSSRAGGGRRGGKSRSKKKSSVQPNITLIAGIGVGGLLIVGVLVALLMRGRDGDVASNVPNAAPGAAGSPTVPGAAANSSAPGDEQSAPGIQAAAAISDEDVAALGCQFVDHLKSVNTFAVGQMIDQAGFVERVVAGLSVSPADKAGMQAGMRTALAQPNGFFGQLATLSRSGQVSFQKVVTFSGEKRALIRILPADGGMTFIELVPTQIANGTIQVLDIYPYMSGDLMSDTMRQVILPVVSAKNASLLVRLTGAEQDAARYMRQIQQVATAHQSGNSAGALQLIKGLPDTVKRMKVVLMIQIQAAQAVNNDAQYVAAMEDFRAAFPNDPSLDFILVDYYTLQQNHSAVMDCLGRLQQRTSGDPYLTYLQGETALEQGDAAHCNALAAEALEAEPDMQEAQMLMMYSQGALRDFDGLLATLKRLYIEHELVFADAPDFRGLNEGIAAFADSPQGREYFEFIQSQPGVQ